VGDRKGVSSQKDKIPFTGYERST